jgi:hypothetical protein
VPVITPDFRALDKIACVGDSLTAPAVGNGVSWYQYLDALLRPSFAYSASPVGASAAGAATYLTSWYRGPMFGRFATAGYTTSDVLANYMAPVYAWRPTGIIMLCEDNGVTNGVTVALETSNITTSIANWRANCGSQLRWIMLVQSPCIGEQRPFGTNAFDTTPPAADADHTLLAKDAILRTLSASLSTGYCEFRDASGNGAWKDYETTYNPGNAGTGVLTIDGRHLTSAPGGSDPPSAGIGGGPFVAAQVLANCTVVP